MIIERPEMLSTLIRHRDTPEIKVLAGVRRCGKSTLLKIYSDQLEQSGVPSSNIFRKRLDDFAVPYGYTAEDLYNELAAAINKADDSYNFYVLLDEVQEVDGWERVVRKLHTREHTDVYITGSNASLLSSELSTLLAGRYVEIPVFPLSFAEVAAYRRNIGDVNSIDDMFRDYMEFGGMPALYAAGNPTTERMEEILSSVYDSVVVRDIATRGALRDPAALEKLCKYMLATSGNLVNPTKIAGALNHAGNTASRPTIEAWLNAMKKAFILYDADQERLRGKALFNPLRKWYPVDNGFRNLATGKATSDLGAQLEGIVFMELKRRGYSVTIGELEGSEIDFVARKGEEKQYIQVSLHMTDDRVCQRELAPLRRLTDAFPRLVITLDWFGTGAIDSGIKITHATDWLLER